MRVRATLAAAGAAWVVGGPAPPLMEGAADAPCREAALLGRTPRPPPVGAGDQGAGAPLRLDPSARAVAAARARLRVAASTPLHAAADKPDIEGRVTRTGGPAPPAPLRGLRRCVPRADRCRAPWPRVEVWRESLTPPPSLITVTRSRRAKPSRLGVPLRRRALLALIKPPAE